MELTHVDEKGAARMVDVGAKPNTLREAVAQAVVEMRPKTRALILAGDIPKGDVFACARIAGIMAAKQTPSLIPMCHPLPIDAVNVELTALGENCVKILATVRCVYHTGVEMEALTAASVAALTVYDMCKAVDRGMVIRDVMLLAKSGGKSGTFVRETTPKLAALGRSPEKGVYEALNSCMVTPEGIEGDRAGSAERQLSLLCGEARAAIAGMDGLCTGRFHANLITEGLDYATLLPGTKLRCGECVFEITGQGKDCYPDCPLRQEGRVCPLPQSCAFARVLRAGRVRVGDAMERTSGDA